LHWADPSSIEYLSLLIEQIPTTKLLLVLTFRPEFMPPWKPRSHLSQLILNRLGRKQVEEMIAKVSTGEELSGEVIEQIRIKTDGVPLFVEELTKSVVESVGSLESANRTPLLLAIPATLQDALMARLDRLSIARQVAQLGATLGREFSHELLQAVAPMNASDLHAALGKLVEAEILYQRGIGQQTRYFFKHALIQDTAYQSLLKSTRQQYHQQIAHVLEERFADTKATQPELLAHHYTEAGLIAQAIPYWQQAGQRAAQRSANAEAISHLTKGLEVLKTLPDTPERTQQELILQITLGAPLQATKGFAAPEVERVYARARELCQQAGETAQLFPVLWGLWFSYLAQAELQTARETGEQLLTLAQSVQDTDLLLEAHMALGATLFHLGEFVLAREHLEQGIALYDPQKHHSHAFVYGTDPGVNCRIWITLVLWFLGYPDQALRRNDEAITLAREISHAFSLGFALDPWIHRLRREGQATQTQAEVLMTFANEQGFTQLLSEGMMLRGWALAERGQEEEGITQIRQGLTAQPARETECVRPHFLALLAEVCGKAGLAKEGLALLDEALAATERNVGRFYEAELYRLKGGLMLTQSSIQGLASRVRKEAEECFVKAIDIARKQQAKSLELRAVMSLARLWQQQGKQAEAHQMLFAIYGWFTEGFDTKDLQEAKALLEELSLSR
jgi:predicted ATPase